ncbi:MAG: DNA replication/repair protein RecF [Saccharofermentanales bacterium]|jgi:DNA replication and repair protein RecF
MQVNSVELTTFRNYDSLKVDIASGINVFYGLNAQGKTNILEAVYVCACARSHRTSRDVDMIQNGSNEYGIKITFTNNSEFEESIEIRYLDSDPKDPRRSRPQRLVYHNGMRLERISELMGLFHAVIFAPEDLMLIKEGPSTRRRYLDLLLSQVRPTYFQELQLFNRLLNQRNRLLKNLRQKIFQRADKMLQPEELMQLETWDHALSGSMSRLIRRRQEYTARISEIAARAHQSISSGQETLGIRYRTITGLRPEMDDQETQQLIAEKLRATMADDIEKGVTGIGPHRDDLEISLNGESLKPYASQGQQRSAVLSMKLAELEIIRLDTGELPVLLLDDVMSELDIIRRHSLLAGIEQAQVLLTCTDKDQVNRQLEGAASDKFSYYEVSKGTVINEEPEAREKTI